MKKTTKTAQHTPRPEYVWYPDEERNRAFICLRGIDNNVAEIWPVEHPDFISAHDVASRMTNLLNAAPDLLAALEQLLTASEILDGQEYPPDNNDVQYFLNAAEQARATIARAKGES